MRFINQLALRFASPAFAIVFVWIATLILVAFGPIDYPSQPSLSAVLLIAACLLLFLSAYQLGVLCFGRWLRGQTVLAKRTAVVLNTAVAVSALAGLMGIGLIALDRTVLSGVSNVSYSAILRCAPDLVEYVEIKRSFLIYLGYLTFSFGFASLALFLLRGEEIRGWSAYLAQLSILSPVGYALLYSGRMPILFMIALIFALMLVRVAQGRSPLPAGHYLLLKATVLVVLFAVYTNAMWAVRRDFCLQMGGLIHELQLKFKEEEAISLANELQRLRDEHARLKNELREAINGNGINPAEITARNQQINRIEALMKQIATGRKLTSPDAISATNLSRMIAEAKAAHPTGAKLAGSLNELEEVIQEAWRVRLRDYVVSAVRSGRLSIDAAMGLLSNYFYLTHGVRIMDLIWQARSEFSPMLGVYEIGVLSPILRVFFPQSEILSSMNSQLRAAEVYGFFPSAWGAAFIDFGIAGAILYILIWGGMAGLAYFGTQHSDFMTPPLVLSFSLASIFLSPLQGPLGVANSALVLVSIIVLGLSVDWSTFRLRAKNSNCSRTNAGEPVSVNKCS